MTYSVKEDSAGLDMWYEWTTSAYLDRYGQVPGFKRGPGRPWTNWRSIVNKDLLRMGITWQEAEVAALNRSEWRRSVAQCIHLDAAWIKVKVTLLGTSTRLHYVQPGDCLPIYRLLIPGQLSLPPLRGRQIKYWPAWLGWSWGRFTCVWWCTQ